MSSREQSPKLPKISVVNKQIYKYLGENEEVPFYVPDDFDQIIDLKYQQKKAQKQKKVEDLQKEIWEKGIKVPMAGKLKTLWKIEEEKPVEDEQQMTIVDAAKSAIKNRVRQKESRRVFVEKKREMFLFQKLIDKKRKQINKFEEMTRLHERGLQKAEELLEKDLDTFNAFLNQNKLDCRDTIKKAEEETKEKQKNIQLIKQKNEQKADLFTKNIQKLETLQQLQKYKTFMEEITPKEVIRQKAKHSHHNKTKKTIFDIYNINIDDDFRKVLEESEEENEMWFSKPEQLESQIESLEEKNLYLIGNNKEIEQKIENVSKKKNQVKNSKDEQVRIINKNKEDLQQKINVLTEDIRKLRNNKIDDETPVLLASLVSEITAQYNAYLLETNQTKKDFVYGIDILREMEAKIEQYIKEITYLKTNPETKDSFIKTEKQIREKRIDKTKNENEIQRQKMEKYKAQALRREKVTKRMGRPIMKKSMLFKEEVQQEVEPQISQEELERILYFT